MASGITVQMRDLARRIKEREQEPREPRPRDRSLRGKARRKARRAA